MSDGDITLHSSTGNVEMDGAGRVVLRGGGANCCGCGNAKCISWFTTNWSCDGDTWEPVRGGVYCGNVPVGTPINEWYPAGACTQNYIKVGSDCTLPPWPQPQTNTDCEIAEYPDPPASEPTDRASCEACCCTQPCVTVSFSDLEFCDKCQAVGTRGEASSKITGWSGGGCAKSIGDCAYSTGYLPNTSQWDLWVGDPDKPLSGTCCGRYLRGTTGGPSCGDISTTGQGPDGICGTADDYLARCYHCGDDPCPPPTPPDPHDPCPTFCAGGATGPSEVSGYSHVDVVIALDTPSVGQFSVIVFATADAPFEGGGPVFWNGGFSQEGVPIYGDAFDGLPCDYPDGIDVPNRLASCPDDEACYATKTGCPAQAWGLASGGTAHISFGGCSGDCAKSCYYFVSATWNCQTSTLTSKSLDAAQCLPAGTLVTHDWAFVSKSGDEVSYDAIYEFPGCDGDGDCTRTIDDFGPPSPQDCSLYCFTLWESDNLCDGNGWSDPFVIEVRCRYPTLQAYDWRFYQFENGTIKFRKLVKGTATCDSAVDCSPSSTPSKPTNDPGCYVKWRKYISVDGATDDMDCDNEPDNPQIIETRCNWTATDWTDCGSDSVLEIHFEKVVHYTDCSGFPPPSIGTTPFRLLWRYDWDCVDETWINPTILEIDCNVGDGETDWVINSVDRYATRWVIANCVSHPIPDPPEDGAQDSCCSNAGAFCNIGNGHTAYLCYHEIACLIDDGGGCYHYVCAGHNVCVCVTGTYDCGSLHGSICGICSGETIYQVTITNPC